MGSAVNSYSMAEHMQEPLVILGGLAGGFVDGVVGCCWSIVEDRFSESSDKT